MMPVAEIAKRFPMISNLDLTCQVRIRDTTAYANDYVIGLGVRTIIDTGIDGSTEFLGRLEEFEEREIGQLGYAAIEWI